MVRSTMALCATDPATRVVPQRQRGREVAAGHRQDRQVRVARPPPRRHRDPPETMSGALLAEKKKGRPRKERVVRPPKKLQRGKQRRGKTATGHTSTGPGWAPVGRPSIKKPPEGVECGQWSPRRPLGYVMSLVPCRTSRVPRPRPTK